MAPRRAPIYLDNHATTMLDPRVYAAMDPWLRGLCANPSSPHAAGVCAAGALEIARGEVASLVGASPAEVAFTATGTEANNLALWGVLGADAAQRSTRGRGRRVVTTAIEHKSVLEPARAAAAHYGYELVVLPVDFWGRVRLEEAQREIRDGTVLVSIQLANNEVGTLQDLAAFGNLARAAGAIYHVDAMQGAGKAPFSMPRVGAQLATLGGHKLHGPKGAAALVVRGDLTLAPLLQGGPQEGGLRPGTENVPALVGFGVACRICRAEAGAESLAVSARRDRLVSLIGAAGGVEVVGPYQAQATSVGERWPHRLYNNLSLHVEGVSGRALVERLAGDLCFSTGAACNCKKARSSEVLRAMGLTDAQGESVVRFGLSRFTTDEEIERAGALLTQAIREARRSPRRSA